MPDQYTMTTAEAAQELGVTVRAVRMAAGLGTIDGVKLGSARRGMWLLDPDSVATYRQRVPGPGRPKGWSKEKGE